ncbi:MAG: AlkZ-related protein [Candidatus Acidiferrales bacterium]
MPRLPGHEIAWPKKVATLAEAGKFIDAAGFCVLFPLKNVALPSLYFAASRKRNADWDAYAIKIWNWKDELGGRRRAFYGKYFRGRGSFISLGMLPRLIALEKTAVAAGDHENFYRLGRISENARLIWESLERRGPLATLELRHECKMTTVAGNKRFKRAMTELGRLLIVVHFGTEKETAAWSSGKFELVCRAFPREMVAARKITENAARAAVARKYLENHAHANAAQIARLFGWSISDAEGAMAIAPGKRRR